MARLTSYRLQWLRRAAAIAAFLPLADALPVCAQSPSTVPAIAPSPQTPPAPQVEYERPVSSRINSTNQPLSLPVAIKDGQREVGEITLRIETDDRIFLPRQVLLEKLGPHLTAKARARLSALSPKGGYLALSEIEKAGLGLSFNPGQLELTFDPGANERAEGELSISSLRGSLQSEPSHQAAKVSGFLNVIGGLDQQWKSEPGQQAQTGGHVDLQGAVRLRGVVLESDATYDGAVDTNRCPTGSVCAYKHSQGLKRRSSRGTYDMPDQQLRLSVGDLDINGSAFLRPTDTLGISLEKSSQKLAPGESIRSIGKSSFRIDRPSDVDIVVNGVVVRHFQLRAGVYNLRDLPFTGGSNEVELVITDDSGAKKSLTFATFYDPSQLGAGKTEWSLSAGAPSYLLDGDRKYDTNGRTGAALLRHGITDDFGIEVSAQADMHIATGSLGLFLQTPVGVIGAQPAVSSTDGKIGLGGRATWDIVGFKGSFGVRESLRLSADYQDAKFRTPGEQADLATKVYRPQALYKLRLTGTHSIALPSDINATLSARYQFDNPEAVSASPYVVRGDRYGVDLTLARALTPWMSGSILAGYSNETQINGFAAQFNNTKPEFRAAVRLSIRPAERTTVTASYDTLNKASQISGTKTVGDGIDRWDASVNAQQFGGTGVVDAGGSIGYTGNRAEIRASHSTTLNSVAFPSLRTTGEDERTSVRVGSAIAFADGMVAVGAPIRGGAFAIVKPHETLAGKEITVGSDGNVMGKTDRLGPALVSKLPAYSSANIPVDVADLPVGYSLGTGSFDLRAPYKAGYALEVGSPFSVTAFGNLVDADDQPISLQSGVASLQSDPKKQVTVFTNAVGRFGADGLAPGLWNLVIESPKGLLNYVINIPAKAEGLHKAGTLRPSGVAAKE